MVLVICSYVFIILFRTQGTLSHSYKFFLFHKIMLSLMDLLATLVFKRL